MESTNKHRTGINFKEQQRKILWQTVESVKKCSCINKNTRAEYTFKDSISKIILLILGYVLASENIIRGPTKFYDVYYSLDLQL